MNSDKNVKIEINDNKELQTITYTRRKKAVNKKQVTFKINIDLLDRVNSFAENMNINKIDVVEKALSEYLDKQQQVV